MEDRFQAWSNLHILVLAITTITICLLIYVGRKTSNSPVAKKIGYLLAIIQILNALVYATYRIKSGYWDIKYDLPMEFCNWSMIVTSIALFTHNRTLAELSYFWVLGGTINGVLTPDLQVTFPHIYFFIFFIAHSGLVIASLYLVIGLKLYPRQWSVPRVWLYSQMYFISAIIIDIVLDSNYGYIMAKPLSKSFMDYLGEWPFYLVNLQITGSIFFAVLYMPFYFINKKQNEMEFSTLLTKS